MTAHHLGEELVAMADGGRGLSPERREELAQHAAGCAECREALRSAAIVLAAVDLEPPLEPSPGFDAALQARLDAIDRAEAAAAPRRANRPSPWQWLADLLQPPQWALAGAAAATIVGALYLTLHTPERGPVGRDDEALAGAAPELVNNLGALVIAEDLELYEELEVVEEDLDVLADLEVIRSLDDAG